MMQNCREEVWHEGMDQYDLALFAKELYDKRKKDLYINIVRVLREAKTAMFRADIAKALGVPLTDVTRSINDNKRSFFIIETYKDNHPAIEVNLIPSLR